MEPNSREERRRIFRYELYKLKEEGYLSESVVETVVSAHQQYHLDLLKEEEVLISKPPISKKVPSASPKPAKVKKTRTPEEIRERNISWSLNIGVIFLLIGGLFVATSNWESMTSLMKSGSIAIVSMLFYGIAFIAKRVLHIDKTAFAFTVLGSLFLPIFILSLGWFGLLGSYLSIDGDGRYILGMLGCFLPLFVYFHFAQNLSSRLFVWFSFFSFSSGITFLLAGLHLKTDYFYLGMVIFNAILILVFKRMKNKNSLNLFTKEFVPYIQVNLILSTLFMIFLFDNEVVYSFNILLTAVIYLSMMYVTGKKEYHFVFTIMLVYGVYQLVENSFLDNADGIVYALVGFGIVFVPKGLDETFSLEKAFKYTSAIISVLAFIYISLEGILLRSGQPTIVLLIAYFIMAGNFLYLSKNSSRYFFPYLSSLFLAAGIYEGISLITSSLSVINIALRLFLTGLILFSVFGIIHLSKYVEVIRKEAVEMGLAIMAIAITIAIFFLNWWELGVMLFLLSGASYLLSQYQERNLLKEVSIWVMPAALGLSITAFGEEMNVNSLRYYSEYGYSVNFAAGAVIVLLASMAWGKMARKDFLKSSLFISQVLYTLAIIHAMVSPINYKLVQPLILLAGIGMYSYFYKNIKAKWIAYFISITTVLSYFSVLNALTEFITFSQLVDSAIPTICAIVLLGIAGIYRKWNTEIEAAFAWVGHIILPLTLVYTWIMYPTDSVFSFIMALASYAVSANLAAKEWKIKLFLYGGFIGLFFVMTTGMARLNLQMDVSFVYPITSALILAFSFFVNKDYKKRTAFYFVPFSIIGIGAMLTAYPYGLIPYLVTWLYIIGLLFYLHKMNLGIVGVVPLGSAFLSTIEYTSVRAWTDSEKMLFFAMVGIIFMITGRFLYKKLFEPSTKPLDVKLDGYTVTAFLYFVYMYFFESHQLWSHALPGTLISLFFWLQRKRVSAEFATVMTIAAGGYLLQPYYSIINAMPIPLLWLREVYVLPSILLVIFIRHCLRGKYVNIVKTIQWLILITVSLILIQDAMASNTIYDAIILGSLSLLSMVAGMYIQIKSYFFVGAGVLLLNVFLTTRPYWGNMPWWVYLLIAGLILITIASVIEWHKQKVQKGESTFITFLKVKIFDKIKKWD